jgi:hypothetical protein
VPALVPKEWYAEEQERREVRSRKRQGKPIPPMEEPRRKGSDYLLSGLVYCGANDGDEHLMHIESIPAKKGKRGNFIFSTSKNSRKVACQAKTVSLKALEKSVIENLLEHVLTPQALRPLARTIAKSLNERNRDVDIRLLSVEAELLDVQRAMNNVLDALEKMGYAPHLYDRYESRKHEEAKLIAEKDRLRALRVIPAHIARVSNKSIVEWLEHTVHLLKNAMV